MTLFQLLTEGTAELERSGNADAANDAKQLLMAAFEVDTVHFLLNRMQPLADDEANRSCTERYRAMIRKRSERIPQQQILGCQEFMGLEFYVNEHVLIPRQDTETLVELVLEEQRDMGTPKQLLDLCTGSGCIALSLAVKGSFDTVTATDLSAEALKVARRNAEALGCGEKTKFYQGDLFAALPEESARKYDVITSNPPYIPTAVIETLEPEVRDHEPRMALDGTEDGLLFYRRIAGEAGAYLRDGGAVYLEIGYDQGDAVKALMEQAGFTDVQVKKDLPGNDRVVRATWMGNGERQEKRNG